MLPGGNRRGPVEGPRHKGVFSGLAPDQAPGFLPRSRCASYGRQQVAGVTQSNNYWSASTYAPNPINAWIVNFNDGNVNNNNKTNNNYVRAVRSGS
jgi:hypothetical protein